MLSKPQQQQHSHPFLFKIVQQIEENLKREASEMDDKIYPFFLGS